MLRILIVDDDEKIRETLTLGLTMNGFEVLAAESAELAWLLIKQNHFDIIILDYVMPVQSGIELCTLIRQQEQYQDTVIIMLTAKDTDADFLSGYLSGVDSYCTKPFKLLQLVLQIKMLVKRVNVAKHLSESLYFQNMELCYRKQTVRIDGVLILLKPKEFALLYYLLNNPNRDILRNELFKEIWGYEFASETRTIDTHISVLRDKLSKCHKFAESLITIRGIGYRFENI